MNVHFKSVELRDGFIAQMVEMMQGLREQHHLESFFFNRYTNPQAGEVFIKTGLFNFDEDAQTRVNSLLETSEINRIEPYECETWLVGRLPIDALKCFSTECYEKILGHVVERPSQEQMGYILHFLMNQLGFGYKEEIQIYSMMIQNIRHTLKQATQ